MFDDLVYDTAATQQQHQHHHDGAAAYTAANHHHHHHPSSSSAAAAASSPPPAPIFQLGRVQYAFNAPLALMTVASNILTMCLYAYPPSAHPHSAPAPPTATSSANPFPPPPPRLVRIDLDDPQRTEEADIPIPPTPRAQRNQPPPDPTTIGPHKMFTDPTGTHVLLVMRNADSYYWTTGWKRARILNKLRGIAVESVAWNKTAHPSAPTAPSNAARKRGAQPTSTTREILVGTRSGDIYEVVINAPAGTDPDDGDFFDKLARRTAGAGADRADVDKVVRHVFALPERQPITGLTAEPFPRNAATQPSATTAATKATQPDRAVVIATTSTRIYEFIGHLGKQRGDETESHSLYEKLFEPYRGDAVPNLKSELPGDLPYSELHTWTPSGRREASALAWLTGPGVYHGLLTYTGDQAVGDSVIDSANLLPYPAIAVDVDDAQQQQQQQQHQQTIAEIPLSIALTEFHFVLLYTDRVMAISSLDDQVIFEESLPLRPDERVIGTAVDVAKRTFWVYTDASIFELVVKDEERDVWRIYLDRGSYDAALRYAKAGVQRGTVLSSQGDRFFAEARYLQAAQCYAQTFMRSFEEVSLRFIEAGQRDALRYYLVLRLERLRPNADGPQRTMLATWLVEIYLGKINQLEDVAAAEAASQDVENYRLERELVAQELNQFLSTYRDVLHPATTYALIQKHGRSEVLLHYAELIGDFDCIVRHHVEDEAWARAIETLQRQESDDLFYRFATTLMRHAPRQAVLCWTGRRSLDPRRLVPALLQHRPKRGAEPGSDQAIAYLRHVVGVDGSTDTAIHNLLLTLLARAAAQQTSNDDHRAAAKRDLLAFIDSARSNPLTSQPYFDLDYALRTCSAAGQEEAAVRIYAKMGLYESAVDLALSQRRGAGGGTDGISSSSGSSNEMLELACTCADMVEGDKDLRKKLWLKIAKEVVRSERDIKRAMTFLSRTTTLSLEDTLPFFPDFTVIDDVKASICDALEGYASHIETLKDEMDEASRSAEAIGADIAALSSRFVSLDASQPCDACGVSAVSRQFYAFPCRHAWHVDCLVALVTRSLGGGKLRRLVEVQAQLAAISAGGAGGAEPFSAAAAAAAVERGAKQGQAGGGGGGSATRALALDKLRDIVSPETILALLSTGVSAGVAGGRRALAPLDPFSSPSLGGSNWVAAPLPRRSRTTNGDVDALRSSAGGGTVGGGRREEAETRADLMNQLDDIIAAECPRCVGAVADVARPFVAREEEEVWAL